MRAVLLFVLGVLLGACGQAAVTPPVQSPSHTADARSLRGKTVALVLQDDKSGEERAYCSGVWVSSTSILTAAHCVDDEAEDLGVVGYVTYDDVFAPGDVAPRAVIVARPSVLYAFDADHDLALLRTEAFDHDFAHTSFTNIVPGAFVQTMGQPLGLWWSYSAGNIASVRMTDVGLDMVWIQATTPISPGNSGCGLFDEYGHLIGLASRTASRGQQVNFFVHAQYIEALLKRAGA